MTRKKKYNYESNSFVAAAEQVYVFSLFLANSCRDSEISVLVRSVNCVKLCARLISTFIDILK